MNISANLLLITILAFSFVSLTTTIILWIKREKTLKQKEGIILALEKLEKVILDTLDFNQTVQKIVDSLLLELNYLDLGYKIIVLALVDPKDKALKRVSISQTAEAEAVMGAGPWRFNDIEIPLDALDNFCIKTITDNQLRIVHDWGDLLSPPIPKVEARRLQKISNVKASMILPVIVKNKTIGVLIFSLIKDEKEVSEEEMLLIKGFTDLVGLAVQNSKLFSELEKTSKQLETVNVRLKELDKLKDDFVSVASHELRTPMTAIKSYLWVALHKKEDELSEDMKRYLSRAYISVERLINLVNDMLNISRIESGRIALKLSEVNLNELVNEVTEEVGVKAQEKGIRVIGLNKQIPKVLADRDKIHEVLLNLIGNSLKFTKAGGTITVDFWEKYPYVYTSVRDTGVGIEPENLSKLFAKFGRLENSYVAVAESGGTGLGLFISKSIVDLHKGQITAQSEGLGKGTTFTFSLPIIGTDIAQKLKDEAPKETDETKDLEKTSVNFV